MLFPVKHTLTHLHTHTTSDDEIIKETRDSNKSKWYIFVRPIEKKWISGMLLLNISSGHNYTHSPQKWFWFFLHWWYRFPFFFLKNVYFIYNNFVCIRSRCLFGPLILHVLVLVRHYGASLFSAKLTNIDLFELMCERSISKETQCCVKVDMVYILWDRPISIPFD